MTSRSLSASVLLGASTLFAAQVFSQQNAPPARPNAQPQARPPVVQPAQPQPSTNVRGPMQTMVSEQTRATCIAIDNQEEVALAQFAAEKAGANDVKEFARKLVDDHQSFLKKLQRFTPEAARNTLELASADGRLNETDGSADAYADGRATLQRVAINPQQAEAALQQQPAVQQQPQQQQQPQPAIQRQSQTQAQAGAPVDLIQLHREMARQCLEDSKKKMSESKGEKFDICFIGHQIVRHEAMQTKLTVLQRHASPEFAELLAEGLESTGKHLKRAEEIMEQLADSGDRQSDRKSKSAKE